MQHDEHPKIFVETRNKQLAQIVDFLTEKHFDGEENLPKVFCGDVNIERNSPEYQNGFARYFENGYVGPEETRKNFTREIWNPNDTDPKVETIDVIGYMHRLGKTANYQKLVKPHLTVQLSHAYGDGNPERSDHHALDGVFRRERQIKV
jgi:hypothetical protein